MKFGFFSRPPWLGVRVLSILLMLAGLVQGQMVIIVPAQKATIQAAIDASSADSIIIIRPGIYYENLRIVDKSLVLLGALAETTIIDGSGLNTVITASNSPINVMRLTIRNGSFTGPDEFHGQGGGGISTTTNLTVDQCVIRDNTSPSLGGGIYIEKGRLRVKSSTITHNSANRGGGIYQLSGSAILDRSDLNSNQGSGGGIHFSQGYFWMNYCSVRDNGGLGSWPNYAGLHLAGADICAVIYNSCFQNNHAGIHGGGIENKGVLQMVNCTISGNTTLHEFGGAGLDNWNGAYAHLLNCTFFENKSDNGNGNIHNNGGAVYIRNTILANDPQGVYPDYSGFEPLRSLGFNLFQRVTSDRVIGVQAGNIYGLDPLLGPLQDNGGLTPTHALLPGSPAIDAGGRSIRFDARDEIRPFDFGVIPNAEDGTDIGAFEAQGQPLNMFGAWQF